MTGVERVEAIRKYLVSDASSWERLKDTGIRLIWNGATKEDHDNAEEESPESNPETPSDPPPPPPPPAATKALSIILQNTVDQVGNVNNWLFFATDRGVSALCRKEGTAIANSPAKDGSTLVDNPPWPGGTFKLRVDNMDCEYKNDGGNAGALWCNGKAISCQEEVARGKGEAGSKACETGDVLVQQHPVVFCEW